MIMLGSDDDDDSGGDDDDDNDGWLLKVKEQGLAMDLGEDM